MAGTVSYLQTGDPELLDVLDDEWLSDTLPDDGNKRAYVPLDISKRFRL